MSKGVRASRCYACGEPREHYVDEAANEIGWRCTCGAAPTAYYLRQPKLSLIAQDTPGLTDALIAASEQVAKFGGAPDRMDVPGATLRARGAGYEIEVWDRAIYEPWRKAFDAATEPKR